MTSLQVLVYISFVPRINLLPMAVYSNLSDDKTKEQHPVQAQWKITLSAYSIFQHLPYKFGTSPAVRDTHKIVF